MKKIIILVLALSLFASLFSCSESEPAETDKTTSDISVLYSENYYFDTFHMWYYIMDCYIKAYNSHSEQGSLSAAGIDPSKPLTEQYFNNTQQTWRDYLLSYGIDQLGQCLVLCEGAKKDGFTISDNALSAIQKEIDDINSYAQSMKITAGELYGSKSITEDHIRHVLTLQQTASEYSQFLLNSFQYTEKEYEEFYNQHKDEQEYTSETYPTANIYVLSLQNIFANNQEFKTAVDRVQNEVKALTSNGSVSPEEFLKINKKFYDIPVNISGLRRNISKGEIYELLSISDFDEWAFSEKRTPGDIKHFYNTEKDLFAVFYYESAGASAWQAAADSDMRNTDYAKTYVSMEKTHAVTVILSNANQIK